MILPRFTLSQDAEGPLVIDHERALVAEFVLPGTAQEVARLLNVNPARVETFYWKELP